MKEISTINNISLADVRLRNNIIDIIYPIGAVYWSFDSTSPNDLFGGEWEQIKDKFVLSAGDTYKLNASGGSTTVKLTESNLPAHTHEMNHRHYTSGSTNEVNTDHSHYFYWSDSHSHKIGKFPLGAGGYLFGMTDGNSNGAINSSSETITISENTKGSNGENSSISHSHTWEGWSTSPRWWGNEGVERLSTASTGSNTEFSILPPYEVAYCWKRIS